MSDRELIIGWICFIAGACAMFGLGSLLEAIR